MPTAPSSADGRRRLLDEVVAADEEQRQRIANALHDDALQVFAAINLRLERIKRRLDDPETLAAIDELEESVLQAGGRLRRLLFELHPPALDSEGLVPALREYVEYINQGRGLEYKMRQKVVAEPAAESRASFFRIAQEALLNVTQHSNASRVEVSLENSRGGIMLTVRDNGVGFDTARAARAGSRGLPAMSMRAEMMDGWCRVESTAGEGTRVRAWLPSPGPIPAAKPGPAGSRRRPRTRGAPA